MNNDNLDTHAPDGESRIDVIRRVVNSLDAIDLAVAIAFAGERLLRLQVAQAEADPTAIAAAMRDRDAVPANH